MTGPFLLAVTGFVLMGFAAWCGTERLRPRALWLSPWGSLVTMGVGAILVCAAVVEALQMLLGRP